MTNVQLIHAVTDASGDNHELPFPWNMQIVTLEGNLKKSNNWWPDMPFTQEALELF